MQVEKIVNVPNDFNYDSIIPFLAEIVVDNNTCICLVTELNVLSYLVEPGTDDTGITYEVTGAVLQSSVVPRPYLVRGIEASVLTVLSNNVDMVLRNCVP